MGAPLRTLPCVGEMNEYIEEYGPIYGATSRIWQAYVRPAGIWYDADEESPSD